MDSQTLDALIAWIGAHPVAAGLVIFLVAFCDAVVILGFAVPAAPILFAVGTLIGLGTLDATYAILTAAFGAFCGDGLSYVFGYHYGDRLRRIWPFSRHPEWITQGETFFARHGTKGIVIARYVGAVRPLVPAIAGMLHMPVYRYALPSAFASVTWAILFISPGWIFGKSLDVFMAVAGRLSIVLLVLLALLVAIYFIVDRTYRFFAPRTAVLLERALAWSHRHPVLGRFSETLIDPHRPESASLALLALLLIGAGWGLFWVLLEVVGHGKPLPVDLAVHKALFALRTPLADHLMAMLSTLGDWQVYGPAAALVFAWLLWRKRRIAAWHWLAAIGFGVVLVEALGRLLSVPKPPAALAVAGFSFPSEPVTMATVVFGFFAVLIARELPGRKRAWPYVLAGLIVALVGFSRLYFGAHWLSDVLAGLTLGLLWVSALGLAYRRRVVRSFWVRPVAAMFFLAVAAAGLWHGVRSIDDTLAQFAPPAIEEPLARGDWWQSGWERLPERRNDFSSARAWPLNVQYAGALSSLQQRLAERGWKAAPNEQWLALLKSFDSRASAKTLPVLAATHNGQTDALVMTRPGANPDERLVVRLWPSPLRLMPGDVPVWQGMTATIRLEQRFGLVKHWQVVDAPEPALEALEAAAGDLQQRRVRRDGGFELLLLRRAPKPQPEVAGAR